MDGITEQLPDGFLPAARFATRQRWHFLAANGLPFLCCVIWFIVYPTFSWRDAAFLIAMWILTGGLGVSLGFHRFFSHRSFEATHALQCAMAAAGSMAAQGPLTYWVSLHRCHHQHSDAPGDPHSPHSLADDASLIRRVCAFFHGHMGWIMGHIVPKPKVFARDLSKSRIVAFFDKSYLGWVVIGIVLPGGAMFAIEHTAHGFFEGCICGGLLRILIGNQIIWGINSVCHFSGSHDFDTHDHSTNNWLMALVGFGEGWHNSHHAFPWSARVGLLWWHVDTGWLALRCFAHFGLASGLKSPSKKDIHDARQR